MIAETSTSVDKKKGPAKAATFPSHGSSKPLKGKHMNAHSVTTPAAAAARDEAIGDALCDLESSVHDLHMMASILADILDDSLVEFGPDARRIVRPVKGCCLKVRLTDDQRERLSFAWNDVVARAQKVQTDLDAVHEARRIGA